MKLRDLLRHLEAHGCELLREGAKHSVYVNRRARKTSTVARHREVDDFLARKICRDLDVPQPDAQIAEVAERLDAHRKAALERDERVTMTGMCNVVEKLRSGAQLTKKEQAVHTLAACGVLKDLREELDALVAEAYGWEWPQPREIILERLVALHDERVREEQAGKGPLAAPRLTDLAVRGRAGRPRPPAHRDAGADGGGAGGDGWSVPGGRRDGMTRSDGVRQCDRSCRGAFSGDQRARVTVPGS